MQYNDPLLRPTRVIPPSGGAISEMIYNDTPNAMRVKTRTLTAKPSGRLVALRSDGLGRSVKTQSIDNQGDVSSKRKSKLTSQIKYALTSSSLS
jgi:hypothetical protein